MTWERYGGVIVKDRVAVVDFTDLTKVRDVVIDAFELVLVKLSKLFD